MTDTQCYRHTTLVGHFIIADENNIIELPIPPTGDNPSKAGNNAGNRGLLTRAFVNSIISDNERARAAFVNRRGGSRAVDDTVERRESLIVLLVTDRRIVFATRDGTVPDDASLSYGDIATATIKPGRVNSVVIESTDSVRWTFQLPDVDTETIDAVRRHLQWIEQVRQEFFELKADIEMTAGKIREFAESMDWEQAQQQYRATRDRLDRFISTLEITLPIANDVLAPELTGVERTLEKAHVTLYIERARSELELGSYLIEHEDSDRPKQVLQRALRFYECATGQQDAVERGDAFEFGTQRTLKREIEELGWELEMVAAEPRRQAEEAKLNAQATDSKSRAIENWETALRRYEQALVLELGDHNREFTGDREELKRERNIAVEMLLDLLDEQSRNRWSEGLDHRQAGRIKDAIRACEDAMSHLDRARELATEYDRPGPPAVGERLSQIDETVTALRTGEMGSSKFQRNESQLNNTPEQSHSSETETQPERDSDRVEQPSEEASKNGKTLDIPSLNDIKTLDTHSEITFTLADPTTERETAKNGDAPGDELRPPNPRDKETTDGRLSNRND